MSSLSSWRIVLRRVLLVLSACGAGMAPGTIWAADVPAALRDRMGGEPDRELVDALDFLLSLSLTPLQARVILPQYEAACRRHTDDYRERAEIQPLEIEAYTAFLDQDRLNQGFTPEVERITGRIHRRARTVREAFITDLNALAAEVSDVLTLRQQQIAVNYRPSGNAVFDVFASPQERRKAARRAKHRARQKAPRPQRGDPRPAEARTELDTLNQAVRPRLDAIAKHLLTPAAAEALYELADVEPPRVVRDAVECRRWGIRDYPLTRCAQDQRTLRTLRQEINNWNLANGMHFSRPQIEQLVYLAEEGERLRAARQQAEPRNKPPRAALDARLVQLELAAEAVLRPGQREVLATYKSCLIPPKNLKDPVRVGQASDGTRMARWLDRARRKRGRPLHRMIDRLIEGEIAHLGPMDETGLEERRSLLRETVRQAADMSDVEFALNQDELADAVRPHDRRRELTAEIDAARRARRQPGRTAKLLLDPGFAEVLKARYDQLVRGTETRRADLTRGPTAPDCEKACAVRRGESK